MSREQIYEQETDNLICGCDNSYDDCENVHYQYADISFPVKLSPTVTIGDIEMEYCDEPVVNCCENRCEQNCNVTVSQKVRIKIPIRYEIDACAGESSINCNSCTSCDE